LVAQAPEWKLPQATTPPDQDKAKANAAEDELIANLAKMPPGIKFAQERARLARALRVRRDDIDAELRTHREDAQVAPLYGHWVVEPWPEPVEGDSLLRDIIRRIHRHVVISHDGALVIALWVVLSWVHDDIAVHSPILNINSAEPESGKSTTMGLIAFLMPKCIASVEVSEAAIYRAIKRWQPSFCFDEFDSILVDDSKAALRSVINSGHTRRQGVLRCVGDDKVPELFSTFAPKALGWLAGSCHPLRYLVVFSLSYVVAKRMRASRSLHMQTTANSPTCVVGCAAGRSITKTSCAMQSLRCQTNFKTVAPITGAFN
jgi:hypothetical protein